MADEHENHRRLHDSGLIDRDEASTNPEEFEKLKLLTSDEVDTLISVREKLGGGQMTQHGTMTSF